MSEFFLTIVNMSISASWIVLAVLLLRLLLKKAPKWITVLLWGIVAVRLICPFSIESALSLIPSAQTISPEIMMDPTPEIHSGFSTFNNAVNPIISESFAPTPGASANPLQIWIPVLTLIWGIGVAAMLAYTAISYWRVKRKIGTAVLLRDNIFQSENVVSPFVLGIFKPKIYLPFKMNEQDMAYVIAHENAHIRRKDHLWKPFGFLLLTIHWFNPLMWLGYILLCRDIELACDEKVIKEMDTEQKADYSQALLTCSVNRRIIAACPLAFGEVSVKNRVKSVLNYKKPAFWIIVVAILISLVVAVCFLTNPASNQLKNIEFLNLSTIANNTVCVLVSDGTGYISVDANKELLTELVDITISKKEISTSRSEGRSRSHTIVLQSAQDVRPRTYSHISGVYIHFNSSFTSVWVDNGVKPTLSYRVLNPAKAKTIYNNIAQSPVVEEEVLDNALICMDLEVLKLNWPMYFDLPTEKGLEVYIWQTNENSYSCGLLPGRNPPYTEQELWDLEKNAAALGVMQTIISYYISNGQVAKEDISIHYRGESTDYDYITREYGSYEAYLQILTDLFWAGIPNADNPVMPTTFSYATCSNTNWIFAGALNSDKMYISSVQHLPIYKFDTLEDLQGFKKNFENHHSMDQGYDEVPSFNAATANYDEVFFSKNSLLLVYVGASNSTHRFGVQSLRYNERFFCVDIKETTGAEAVDTAMAGWFITVAVPDKLIENCEDFDAFLASSPVVPEDGEIYTDLKTTFSYAGSTTDHWFHFNDRNWTYVPWSDIFNSPIYKLDTLEDLAWFKENIGIHYSIDQSYEEVPSFNAVTAEYDEVFFENNSLILLYVCSDNSAQRFAVKSIAYNTPSFCINIEETTGVEKVKYDPTAWFLTVAVPDELVKNCTQFYSSIPENNADVIIVTGKRYEKTPAEDIQSLTEKEEDIYTHTHYQTEDGIWHSEGYEYENRLDLVGRMNNAEKGIVYYVLSNEPITFNQAWKASGFSSNSEDYFDPDRAMIVGYRIFSSPSSRPSTNSSATTPNNNNSNYKFIVHGQDISQGNYVTDKNIIGIYDNMYLPFTAILKCYGAKVNWTEDTVAEISFNGSKYILNLSDVTLVKEGSNGNYIIPAPGSTLYTKVAGKELLIDSLNLRCILGFMGINVKVDINHLNKTVTIQ